MDEIIIYTQAQTLAIKEYQGQRVVTFKDIDTLHQRPEGTADRNFRENISRFIEGEDYFKLTKNQNHEIRGLEIPNRGLTVFTQFGYLMLVKSFTDDLAWHIQRQLVKNYFDMRTSVIETAPDKRLAPTPPAKKNLIETAFVDAINEALCEGYYLVRRGQRKTLETDEAKLLGKRYGDVVYILSQRAYGLYAAKDKEPVKRHELYAHLFIQGLIEKNECKVAKYGKVTHSISIFGKEYRCLAFYADKVKFK